MRVSKRYLVIGCVLSIASLAVLSRPSLRLNASLLHRSLSAIPDDSGTDWKLPHRGCQTWCDPPELPPFRYDFCNKTDTVNIIPLTGGLTNALKMIMLGAIRSIEQNRCFAIDEQAGHLKRRTKKENEFRSFLNRYFEPIGLSMDDPVIQNAIKKNNTERFRMEKILTDPSMMRLYGSNQTVRRIIDGTVDGHILKFVTVRRLWRPLVHVREDACQKLENYGLQEDYIAMSVRRGDKKSVEHFEFQDLNSYLLQADEDIRVHFGGKAPKIFVATDDCSVLADFRAHRPQYTFISECDALSDEQEGFALQDVGSWTKEQTDAHFKKFFVELYAMALSKVFIGVSYTNIAWWIYFMRGQRHTFRLLDQHREDTIEYW